MPADAVSAPAPPRGRSVQHVLVGVALTAGAVALSAVLACALAPAEEVREVYSDYEEPEPVDTGRKRAVFAAIWPPLFMALTISGLKIWNAPRSPARTQALTLWGVTQALNAVWMALGPARLGGQLATAVASLGAAAAYAWRAHKVDADAAGLVAPYLGWMGLANVISEEFGRRVHPPTSLR
jgi:tryptophan-rich sensory protein